MEKKNQNEAEQEPEQESEILALLERKKLAYAVLNQFTFQLRSYRIKPDIKLAHRDLIVKKCMHACNLAFGYLREIKTQSPDAVGILCASYITFIDYLTDEEEHVNLNDQMIIRSKYNKYNWTIDIGKERKYKCAWGFTIYDMTYEFKIGFMNKMGQILFQFTIHPIYDFITKRLYFGCKVFDFVTTDSIATIAHRLIPIRKETQFKIIFDAEKNMSWIKFDSIPRIIFNENKKAIDDSLLLKKQKQFRLFCKCPCGKTKIKLNSFNVSF